MVEAMEIKAGYKQTEVGIIPMDWDVKKLTDLVDKFVNGGTPSTQITEYWNGNIPWITGADILNQKVAVIRRYISKEAVKNSSTNIIEKGNLLLVSRTGVGKLAITPFDIAISQDFTGVYVKSSELDTVYLFRYFDFAQKELKTQNQGTSIQGITRETLSSVKIPLPPTKAEQTAIATALNDADALITQLEKLIAKKRAIKQGAMQELLNPMVNCELRMENGEKNSQFTTHNSPFLKEGWEVKKLGEIADIRKGQLITESTRINGNIPVIAGGKTPAYYHNKPNRLGKTITISGSGASAGYVSFYSYPIFASDCSTISESPNHSIEYIFYLLQLLQEKIYKMQTGGAQPHIHPNDINPIEIPFPPIDEQTRIAQILSDMDAEIEALEKKRDKYKMIKQGMMQVLLTGRVRLI